MRVNTVSRDLFFLAFVPLFALSCSSTVPTPVPIRPDSSALGLSLRIDEKMGPITTARKTPDVVVFMRLEEGETLDDLTSKDTLIPCTRVEDECAYLLDVDPGTYVAVAALYWEESEGIKISSKERELGSGVTGRFSMELFGDDVIYRNYFSRELIAETMTTVEPESFGFMGHYVTSQSFRFGEADEAQVHILHLLEGEDVDREGFFDDIFSKGMAKRLTPSKIEKGLDSRVKFCKEAKKHLKHTGWVPMLDRLMVREQQGN